MSKSIKDLQEVYNK